MTRFNYTDSFIQDCIKLNSESWNICDIVKHFGLANNATLVKRMKAAGHIIIHHKVIPHNFRQLPEDEICELFKTGASTKQLSEQYNIARHAIDRCLIKNGYKPRNRSESMFNRMSMSSIEERKILTEKAHEAARGKKKSEEVKQKIALTRSRMIGFGENILQKGLVKAGFNVSPQHPFDIYNIDLLINGSIAVEIISSTGNPFRTKRFREKIKALLHSGLHVIIFQFVRRNYFVENIGNTISYIQRFCANPPSICEYRVVLCGAKVTIARNDLNQFTSEGTTIEPIILEKAYNLGI